MGRRRCGGHNAAARSPCDPAHPEFQTGAMAAGFVYILASKRKGTLYIGITSDLPKRMQEHLDGHGSQFAKKYGVTRLVYFEEYPLYADAIRRETNLKRWKRAWKIALIEKHNPRWRDLLENWNC
jgi:putative endonuclease